jgi:hypothetical protein
LKRFTKIFPIEADVEMFYPIVALITPEDQGLDMTDSALYQEALLQIRAFMILWFMQRKYKNDSTLFLHFSDYPPLKRTWTSFEKFPVRVQVRIDPPHPLVCRKRRLNGTVLRMRPEKPRSRVTACETQKRSLPAQRP